MQAQSKNVFDVAADQLREFKFSKALQLASAAARQYKLYQEYKSEFINIRILAFQNKDFGLAAEKLAVLLRKLSDEISGGRA